MQNNVLLEINNLQTQFFLDEGTVKAVNGVDLTLRNGATLGVVGESGCGKSVTAFSILQLIQKPGRIVDGEVWLHRQKAGDSAQKDARINVAGLDPKSKELRKIRGGEISMIFQEPMTSLSLVHTVGFQIIEAIRLHSDLTEEQARERAISLLRQVGIPKPEQRVDAYPFELSGGMRQRVMIAMALSCNPSLLIADEPTTALDVTTQAQILELILDLQQQFGMAMMLITHDLGVVAETCDDVAVMYLGQVVEQADVDAIFYDPKHPYTKSLLRSIPRLGHSKEGRLNPIAGSVPDPYNRPTGCPFHPRCPRMMPGICDTATPSKIDIGEGRSVRCLLYEQE